MNIQAKEITEKTQRGQRKKGPREGQLKYDNRFRVSYPDEMYIRARRWAMTKGVSIQDIQRQAMEHYLNYLEKTDKTERAK